MDRTSRSLTSVLSAVGASTSTSGPCFRISMTSSRESEYGTSRIYCPSSNRPFCFGCQISSATQRDRSEEKRSTAFWSDCLDDNFLVQFLIGSCHTARPRYFIGWNTGSDNRAVERSGHECQLKRGGVVLLRFRVTKSSTGLSRLL